jgi:CRISPR-associated protein Cas5t
VWGMNVIRFEIEGILNSFRIPAFKAYHRTFLAPPKSTVIGMLCNISLKSQKEFFEILEKDLIEVSVIIKKIKGKTKDLWSYKTFNKKNRGKNVIRRDKLFLPEYVVYLNIKDNNLFNEILNALKNPKNIPSLGLDDEIVTIKNIKEINIEENDTNIIDSVFANKGLNYKAYIKDKSKPIYLPVFNDCGIKFKAFDKKGKFISREVIENMMQVEFINCEIEFNENINSYKDKELNYKLVFY